MNDKKNIEELYSRGRQALEAGDFKTALSVGREMEDVAPEDPAVWAILGQAYLGLNNLEAAANYLLAVLDKDPENETLRRQLTEIYRKVSYFEEAVEMFRPVFENSPEVVEKYTYFGQLAALGGAEKEALACFQKADDMAPGNAEIKAALGRVLLSLGRVKEARAELEAALSIDPDNLEALVTLADTGPLSQSRKKTLEKISKDKSEHPGRRVDAAFGLAKAVAGENDAGKTFKAYERANQQARELFAAQNIRYESAAEWQTFKANAAFYTQALFEAMPEYPKPNLKPLFIIGLPRSGTTLVEQILGAHSAVQIGGEIKTLGEFPLLLQALVRSSPGRKAAEILALNAASWRAKYFEKINALAKPGHRFVSDKMPLNFLHVGMARALFPEAKFIFLKRQPLDNCLSMYFQPLTQSYPATVELEALGDFYRLFEAYLNHWRGLPGLDFLELEYEALVAEPEREAKKLVDFLDLPWEEACLEFHKKGGPVRTLSMLQVREPVSKKYVGRWKKFEKHLKPLKTALDKKA